jgi:hypothetical protein
LPERAAGEDELVAIIQDADDAKSLRGSGADRRDRRLITRAGAAEPHAGQAEIVESFPPLLHRAEGSGFLNRHFKINRQCCVARSCADE